MRLNDLPEGLRKKVQAAIGGAPKRRHKFNVSPKEDRTVDGIVFASLWEMRVYLWLKRWIDAPVVLQPRFLLLEKSDMNARETAFVADFLIGCARTEFTEAGELPEGAVVIDAKGMRTDTFKLKKKLFQHRYRRTIFLPKTQKQLWDFDWANYGIKTKYGDDRRNS